jgi:Fur family ferric uptake transcriptional regulator
MATKRRAAVTPRRQTRQREIVLKVLGRARCHLTAEEVHARAGALVRGIGLATVYRTLELFAATGVVEPAHLADGRVHFGLAAKHHDHAICVRCGTWESLAACALPRPPRRVPAGFKVTGHALEFYGVCAACQAAR